MKQSPLDSPRFSIGSLHKRKFIARPLVPITNNENERSPTIRKYKVFSKLTAVRRRPVASLNNDVLHWLQSDCPQDVVLRVLAFAGPQTASALSKTNRYWKEVMDDEETWRVLCEQLYKVRDGIVDCFYLFEQTLRVAVLHSSGHHRMIHLIPGKTITVATRAFQWIFLPLAPPWRLCFLQSLENHDTK
jgi:hypothetical protein